MTCRQLAIAVVLLLSGAAATECPKWFNKFGANWQAKATDSPGLQMAFTAPRCNFHCQGSWASTSPEFTEHPPLLDDTPYRLGSATKPFTAVTVMQLVEQGVIDIQGPVVEYLPDWGVAALEKTMGVEQAGQITPWMLLHHTSGLPNHLFEQASIDLFEKGMDVQFSHQEVLEFVSQFEPYAAPGEEFMYSDVGFHYLGALIEHVTGQALGSAVRAAAGWDRLGMSSTYWESTDEPTGLGPLARQYADYLDTTDMGKPTPYGGSGVVSNAQDLDTWVRAFHTGQLLGEEGMKLTYTKVDTGPNGFDFGPGYGCGWLFDVIDGHDVWFHRGAWATWMYYVPSLDLSVGGTFNQVLRRPSVRELVSELMKQMQTSKCRTGLGVFGS